jgi:hypothetical protein
MAAIEQMKKIKLYYYTDISENPSLIRGLTDYVRAQFPKVETLEIYNNDGLIALIKMK